MIKSLRTLAGRAFRSRSAGESAAHHDFDCVYRSLRARLVRQFGPALAEQRVLDFGCGYRYPNVVLLSRDVGDVVGVDVAPVYRDGWAEALLADLRRRKTGTAVEGVLRYVESGSFYRQLESRVGPVRHSGYRLLRCDGSRIPLEDGSFDCVISNAVLQELPLPLEPFAAEIARVLKPGGFIDLEWHNFYSLTGNYRGEAESRREPWGHLLGGCCHPTLNRVTPADVTSAFSSRFGELRCLAHDRDYRIAGLDAGFELEGDGLLTDGLRQRLNEYPPQWLLTRGFILQGRRR